MKKKFINSYKSFLQIRFNFVWRKYVFIFKGSLKGLNLKVKK